MLGPSSYLPVLLGLLFIALAVLMAHASRTRVVAVAAWFLALFMAYAGPTVASVKIAQFAAPMQALLVLATVHACVEAIRVQRRRADHTRGARWRALAPAAVLLVATVCTIWRYTFTFPRLPRNPEARALVHARSATVENIVANVLERTRSRKGVPRVAIAGGPAEYGRDLLVWRALRESRRIHADDLTLTAAVNDETSTWATDLLKPYDLIVVNEGRTELTEPKRSRSNVDMLWWTAAETDPSLRIASEWTAPGTNQRVRLYERVRNIN